MVLGMSLETFTFLHVVISMVGIMTGIIVVAVMLQNGPIAGWNGFFLTTTILTSVTGFFFPVKGLLPSHIVGIISLVVLAIALFAYYSRHLMGPWRAVYVVCAVIALWLGHESVETTQMYIHADMQIKETAMARTRPVDAKSGRYRPGDKLLAFLEAL